MYIGLIPTQNLINYLMKYLIMCLLSYCNTYSLDISMPTICGAWNKLFTAKPVNPVPKRNI